MIILMCNNIIFLNFLSFYFIDLIDWTLIFLPMMEKKSKLKNIQHTDIRRYVRKLLVKLIAYLVFICVDGLIRSAFEKHVLPFEQRARAKSNVKARTIEGE